ncbi:hypothetical protein BU14_0502s0008 [Porphyra umbilicalis]|uniref:Uncharacterized protein n=1 Tax=Porphyra umbilicalis TaxID=2786 RepID=A0A1X6NT36_PORUM|nr:hypothetical protein BU14_0502s0008 [Porphyra umbilicalis]|eukprot:OSX71774.1 hypothetical protein BU14_0502s0008 [Porphyra umbilicalis]
MTTMLKAAALPPGWSCAGQPLAAREGGARSGGRRRRRWRASTAGASRAGSRGWSPLCKGGGTGSEAADCPGSRRAEVGKVVGRALRRRSAAVDDSDGQGRCVLTGPCSD